MLCAFVCIKDHLIRGVKGPAVELCRLMVTTGHNSRSLCLYSFSVCTLHNAKCDYLFAAISRPTIRLLAARPLRLCSSIYLACVCGLFEQTGASMFVYSQSSSI